MGLDLFDGLSAIGAGMSKYGEIKQEDKKRKMAEEAEARREKRQDERDERRWKREQDAKLAQVDGAPRLENRNGKWVEVGRNSQQTELFVRDAPPNIVEDVERAKKIEDAKLADYVLRGDVSRKQLEFADQDQADQHAESLANRMQSAASARASDASARRQDRPDPKNKPEREPTHGEATAALLSESTDLQEEYSDIKPHEWRLLAAETTLKAAKAGRDPRIMFTQVIQNYLKRKAERGNGE